jgi:hypothetical protein
VDPYAVAAVKDAAVVGHVPRKISAPCSLFLHNNGIIQCTITGKWQFSGDFLQGGLEVPCKLTFRGDVRYVQKVQKLLTPACSKSGSTHESIAIKTTQDCDGEPPSKKMKLASDHIILDGEDPVISNAGVAPVMWLEMNNIILTKADRRIIVTGEDKHIHFAQMMLKNQFQEILGLQSTLLLSAGKHTCISLPPSNVIHTRGNHWLVVSTIRCASKVQVFDSIYSDIDKHTRELLLKLFGTDVNIQMQNAPKQQGIKDCGVFATAICTLFAHGNFPIGSHVTFNQSVM